MCIILSCLTLLDSSDSIKLITLGNLCFLDGLEVCSNDLARRSLQEGYEGSEPTYPE